MHVIVIKIHTRIDGKRHLLAVMLKICNNIELKTSFTCSDELTRCTGRITFMKHQQSRSYYAVRSNHPTYKLLMQREKSATMIDTCSHATQVTSQVCAKFREVQTVCNNALYKNARRPRTVLWLNSCLSTAALFASLMKWTLMIVPNVWCMPAPSIRPTFDR